MTLQERFDAKVYPEPNTGCWLWGAYVNANGYGLIKVDGRVLLAHRVGYALYKKAPIPPELFACHTCDNPACVNPDHIFIGTARDNSNDREKKGRGHLKHGIHNGRAKFDRTQVHVIRDARSAGFRRDEIASYFKRPVSVIDDIIYNRSWRTI